MATTQKQRLLNFLSYLQIGRNEFEKRIGVGIGSVTRAHDTRLSSLLLTQTHTTYPNLNMLWLLYGTGDMILPDNLTMEDIVIRTEEFSGTHSTLADENRQLKADNQTLREKVRSLEDINASLRYQAKTLLEQKSTLKGRKQK